jgi:hypothetical protein
MLFTFRVLIDYEKDVFRDVICRDDQTFMEFSKAIISAFDFSGDQMSSFYMSNDNWDKGEEIVQFDMGFEEESKSMENTLLKDMVAAKDQKILYIYDFLKLWIFYIELTSIESNKVGEYPQVLSRIGISPKEDDKSDDFEMPQDHIGEDAELDPELRDLMGGSDEDDQEYIDPNDLSNFY